eukprot:6205694-Pleurochrysis_carterae.AAC.3
MKGGEGMVEGKQDSCERRHQSTKKRKEKRVRVMRGKGGLAGKGGKQRDRRGARKRANKRTC